MTGRLIGPELGTKTPRMIGREDEIDRLTRYLHDRQASHFVYYWAEGGRGKTRLLQELQRLVQKAGLGYYSTGILDLYHTDLHGISDLERAIIDGLDPEQKHFRDFRLKRQEYEELRERGAAPAVLEERRRELPAIFERDFNLLARAARKIVLCFDTIELLQYQATAIQDLPGLQDLDVSVRAWLLNRLGRLGNVLVVFAGRPLANLAKQDSDPQARLVAEMRAKFGDDLDVVELKPFAPDETQAFLDAIQPAGEPKPLIPQALIPIVSALAGGQPILLHLIVDLLYRLAREPQAILDDFATYQKRLGTTPDASELDTAREALERDIIGAIYDVSSELGRYLQLIALMPKGVNADILELSFGLSLKDARALLEQLQQLSFVKTFAAPPGAPHLHADRVFLHDEMYRLIRLSGVVPDLAINERMMVSRLVGQYYTPRIKELETAIKETAALEERAPLWDRMRKLQTECLYYTLTWDAERGYALYRALSDEANHRRETGFAMRLLDEMLRFFNTQRGRKAFERIGLTEDQIIRDDARMWAERLNWWGRRDREHLLRYARYILDHPEEVHLRKDQDHCLLGHIAAFWGRAVSIVEGYNIPAAEELAEYLDRLPPLAECSADEALARARLLVTIGSHYKDAGQLVQATESYTASRAAFLATEGHDDEYAMLLNNLAFLHAQLGRTVEARSLAHESLHKARELGNRYVEGLASSTLAGIATYRSNYDAAFRYGMEAIKLLQDVGDPHGESMAQQTLAKAYRWAGAHEAKKGLDYDLALQYLERALSHVEAARKEQLRLTLLDTEEALIHMERGDTLYKQGGLENALTELRIAEEQIKALLSPDSIEALSRVDRANMYVSLAQVQHQMRDYSGVNESLGQLQHEDVLGSSYLIVPGKQQPPRAGMDYAFHPLSKAEWLRMQMALDAGQIEQTVAHLALAYAYASHYSSRAILIQFIVDEVHTEYLTRASTSDREHFMELVCQEAQKEFGVPMEPLVEMLQHLV